MENLNLHILLAEDNVLCQKIIRIKLKSWNCDVEIVNNGKDAVDSLEKDNYHVVLMDIQMPIMDGYEATTCIRQKIGVNKNIPVIATTSLDSDKDIYNFTKVGFDGYVTKPFNDKLLYDALKKYSDFSNTNLKQVS